MLGNRRPLDTARRVPLGEIYVFGVAVCGRRSSLCRDAASWPLEPFSIVRWQKAWPCRSVGPVVGHARYLIGRKPTASTTEMPASSCSTNYEIRLIIKPNKSLNSTTTNITTIHTQTHTEIHSKYNHKTNDSKNINKDRCKFTQS